MMQIVWIVAIVVFVVAELSTMGLVSIWFVAGSVAGLIATLLGCGTMAQLSAFVLVSAVCLLLTRPMVLKMMPRRTVATNADRVVGAVGRVKEAVDEEHGAVYVDGKMWTARSTGGVPIPVDAHVQIDRIEGVKLYVTEVVSSVRP